MFESTLTTVTVPKSDMNRKERLDEIHNVIYVSEVRAIFRSAGFRQVECFATCVPGHRCANLCVTFP